MLAGKGLEGLQSSCGTAASQYQSSPLVLVGVPLQDISQALDHPKVKKGAVVKEKVVPGMHSCLLTCAALRAAQKLDHSIRECQELQAILRDLLTKLAEFQ